MILFSDGSMNTEAVDQILAEIEKTLYEMRNLAIYAARNDITNIQRDKVQARIDELKKEIDGIAAMLMPPDAPIQ
jgi:flagellin-like hook-associated protein FlgL